jgi:hypothetical protein
VASAKKVPVTERALMQRLNRKLRPDFEVKRLTGAAAKEYGRFVVVNLKRGTVVESNFGLAAYALHAGVLKPWEEIGK